MRCVASPTAGAIPTERWIGSCGAACGNRTGKPGGGHAGVGVAQRRDAVASEGPGLAMPRGRRGAVLEGGELSPRDTRRQRPGGAVVVSGFRVQGYSDNNSHALRRFRPVP